MPRYETNTADAPWIKCDVCGQQSAIAIDVIPTGKSSRRGKRCLGFFCREHGQEKLATLRSKAAKGTT